MNDTTETPHTTVTVTGTDGQPMPGIMPATRVRPDVPLLRATLLAMVDYVAKLPGNAQANHRGIAGQLNDAELAKFVDGLRKAQTPAIIDDLDHMARCLQMKPDRNPFAGTRLG